MLNLVNISGQRAGSVQIFGFDAAITVAEVAAAVEVIASQLAGAGYVIHIMSGTHGFCEGKVGQVASRDQRFYFEDCSLAHPTTSDGHRVTLDVQDFNTNIPMDPDWAKETPAEQLNLLQGAVMAKLNGDIRKLVPADEGAKHIFLLAYCCSAGVC